MKDKSFGALIREAMKPKEQFKQILLNGIPSQYIISSYGYVITTRYHRTEKITRLVPYECTGGYVKVRLSDPGDPKQTHAFTVHRLVAEYFIPNIRHKPEVNHIDGNKKNNAIWNLEWVDRSENMEHAFRTGLAVAKQGDENQNTKFSDAQIKEVCELLESVKYTVADIVRMTGVNKSVVMSVLYKKARCSVSDAYDFTEFLNSDYFRQKESYSDDQIREVCEELVRNELDPRQIESKTGVSYDMIKKVTYGLVRTDISKDYDFSHYNRRCPTIHRNKIGLQCSTTRESLDEDLDE